MATQSSEIATLQPWLTAIMQLKLLPRTGWLQHGIATAESIAEHSFGVSALALAYGSMHEDIDMGRLLGIAIIHDMAEAQLSDLPRSARLLIGTAIKQAAERQALEQLLAEHPRAEQVQALWEDYAAGRSREARLVKALDRLEMLAQALSYERAGHRRLDEFWEGLDVGWDEFPQLAALALALFAQRRG